MNKISVFFFHEKHSGCSKTHYKVDRITVLLSLSIKLLFLNLGGYYYPWMFIISVLSSLYSASIYAHFFYITGLWNKLPLLFIGENVFKIILLFNIFITAVSKQSYIYIFWMEQKMSLITKAWKSRYVKINYRINTVNSFFTFPEY